MQHKIKGLVEACPESWSPRVLVCDAGRDVGPEKKGNSGVSRAAAGPGPQEDSLTVRLDEQWVVTRLVEVAQRCMQAVEPPLQAGGKPGGEWKFDTGGAIRALTLLGKHLGMFSERVEQESNVHEDALDELK